MIWELVSRAAVTLVSDAFYTEYSEYKTPLKTEEKKQENI